jgi:FtsP/CotA-like multicopper oxidase with cupredoxin domain
MKEFNGRMKESSRSILNYGSEPHGVGNQAPNRAGVAQSAAPQRNLIGRVAGIAPGIALLLLIAAQAQAQNLGSPPFANPPEVRYRAHENRLRMVMELYNGKYQIPNVGTETLRQFRGYDPAFRVPPLSKDISPGPTLRARLGDRVEVSFLNRIDDSKFPYTFVTDSQPGASDFGCDQTGKRNPLTHLILPYPGKDKYPNCFHGSSTANIHFHGTHTSPDGLGDNVLVQVLPQARQLDWRATFDQIFSGNIPQKWLDLPANYRTKQMAMIAQHDADAKAAAIKNGLPPPEPLAPNNQHMIDAGLWPQYIMGAFPNFFEIPDYSSGKFNAGQAPGTHWYHAHKHGSTSLHMMNGLAGALIIESNRAGGYDHFIRNFYGWGTMYGDHEKILVFQEYDPTQNLERAPRGAAGGPPVNPGKGTGQALINGKLKPTITMRPGDVQLWRFVNATPGQAGGGKVGVIFPDVFQTKGFKFKQTAIDGVQFSPGNYVSQPFLNGQVPNALVVAGIQAGLQLAAGNRADVLVQAPDKTGVYTFKSNGKTVFFVSVKGAPVVPPNGPFPMKWAAMPNFLHDLPKPGPSNIPNPDSPVKFQWEANRAGPGLIPKNDQGSPPHYMINDKQFEEMGPKVDQCMPLNGLQDWVLENHTTVSHPFHIHINPFQVIKIETPTAQNQYSTYAPPNNYVWQDVIALPPAVITTNAIGQVTNITPSKITIRQAYLDFTGTYVLHCHILAHEDRGMMQLVRVVPARDYPTTCQKNIPGHH